MKYTLAFKLAGIAAALAAVGVLLDSLLRDSATHKFSADPSAIVTNDRSHRYVPPESAIDKRIRPIGTEAIGAGGLAVTDFVSSDDLVALDADNRELAITRVRAWYSFLLENLDIPNDQRNALLMVLVEDLIHRTTRSGVQPQQNDHWRRSDEILAVLGEEKFQQFMELESNLFAFAEVQAVESIFEQAGSPISTAQRDDLLRIIIDTRSQVNSEPREKADLDSVAYLEQEIIRHEEYERLLLELAPSVLSAEQVQLLFDLYQDLAYDRAASLDRQRKWAGDPTRQELPLHYPAYPPAQ